MCSIRTVGIKQWPRYAAHLTRQGPEPETLKAAATILHWPCPCCFPTRSRKPTEHEIEVSHAILDQKLLLEFGKPLEELRNLVAHANISRRPRHSSQALPADGRQSQKHSAAEPGLDLDIRRVLCYPQQRKHGWAHRAYVLGALRTSVPTVRSMEACESCTWMRRTMKYAPGKTT